MKKNIQNAIIVIALLLSPNFIFGQAPPNLGIAASFVLFSSNGAVTHTGAGIGSHITGDVGSQAGGPSSGFGNINGVMHDADGVSASAATDLNLAYLNVNVQGPATAHGLVFGSETLFAGIYSTAVGVPASLGGILTLDGQGDPNAYFLFQVGFDFSSAALAEVKLINGAKACNVFWKVEGAVALATGTTFRGTIIANNAAISIAASGVILEGRALSTTGAVSVNTGLTAYTPVGCGSPTLTGPLAPSLGSLECYALLTQIGALSNTGISAIIGDIGTNGGGLVTGFTAGMVTGTIHATPDASTAQGSADMNTLYTYLNGLTYDIELLYPYDFGHSLVLTPHVYRMKTSAPAALLTDTIFLDAMGNPNAVFVIQIDQALVTTSYSNVVLINGAKSSNVFWKIEGAIDIADHSIFRGTILTNNGAITFLTPADTLDGRALSTSGAITTNSAGLIAINTSAPSITASGSTTFCQGGSVILTASSSLSYTWSTGANTQSITVTTAGTYSVATTGACGNGNSASVLVTVIPSPTITLTPTSTSLCGAGSSTITANGATTYSWSPATGLSSTTGSVVTATPIITTTYVVTGTSGTCSSKDSVVISVAPSPTLIVIASSNTICTSGSATLTANGATTYSWSPATGLSSTTGSMVIASPIITTTYVVTGTSGTCSSKDSVVINIAPSPTLIVSASSNTICTSGSATLTANGATTYSWSPATGLSSTTGSVVIANPIITTTYVVTGTSGTCSSKDSVVINIAPSPTLIVSASSNTICTSGSSTLTANGATTYSWSPATGLSSTTGSVVTATPIITTTYVVTGTSGTCSSKDSLVITVVPVLTLTVSASSNTICTSGSSTLTANGATTYSWSPATGLSSTTGSVVTANPIITTTYVVTGTSGTCSSKDSLVITVVPVLTLTVSASSNTICTSSSATLTASGASTYSWSPATGLSSTTGSVVTANPIITTTYVVTGTSGTCSSKDSLVITVVPSPTITVSASSNTICTGNSSTLTANGATTYSWSPATGLSSTTGSVVTATPTITTTYSVIGTSGACSATQTITITVNPLPVVTITPGGATTFCQGGNVVLSASPGSSYVWSTGATTQSITVNSSGNYSVTVTNGNGCSATSAVIAVTVNPLPTAGFTSAQTAPLTYSFTNTSSNATSYVWNFGDTQTSTATNPVNMYATAGNYTVTLIATNACGTDTFRQVITVTNVVSEFEFFNGYSPNGDNHNDYWNIPMLGYYKTNTVLIINRWGNEVWKGINYDNKTVLWTGKNMNGDDLADGTYYYIITYNNTEKRGWVFIKR